MTGLNLDPDAAVPVAALLIMLVYVAALAGLGLAAIGLIALWRGYHERRRRG